VRGTCPADSATAGRWMGAATLVDGYAIALTAALVDRLRTSAGQAAPPESVAARDDEWWAEVGAHVDDVLVALATRPCPAPADVP
jgi:hypothetical protein